MFKSIILKTYVEKLPLTEFFNYVKVEITYKRVVNDFGNLDDLNSKHSKLIENLRQKVPEFVSSNENNFSLEGLTVWLWNTCFELDPEQSKLFYNVRVSDPADRVYCDYMGMFSLTEEYKESPKCEQ